jgi:hypothetical protein
LGVPAIAKIKIHRPGAFFAAQKTGLSAPIFFAGVAAKKDFRFYPLRGRQARCQAFLYVKYKKVPGTFLRCTL